MNRSRQGGAAEWCRRWPSAAAAFAGTLAAVASASAARPPTVDVIEYYNATRDHYFITSLPFEIAALDAGRSPVWSRTGFSFRAYAQPFADSRPVCRFYIPPARGDSHFHSASADECSTTQATHPFFVLESPNAMYVGVPDSTTGDCPPGDVPVYRTWNARFDSNHRYTTLRGIRAQMIARGWVAQGYGPDHVAMCVPPSPAPQIVFMKAVTPALAPGPGAVYEIAVTNLDGSGFRQWHRNRDHP